MTYVDLKHQNGIQFDLGRERKDKMACKFAQGNGKKEDLQKLGGRSRLLASLMCRPNTYVISQKVSDGSNLPRLGNRIPPLSGPKPRPEQLRLSKPLGFAAARHHSTPKQSNQFGKFNLLPRGQHHHTTTATMPTFRCFILSNLLQWCAVGSFHTPYWLPVWVLLGDNSGMVRNEYDSAT